MKFGIGQRVSIARQRGYLGLGDEGIVLAIDEEVTGPYPYIVVVGYVRDGGVDALAFAENELEAI